MGLGDVVGPQDGNGAVSVPRSLWVRSGVYRRQRLLRGNPPLSPAVCCMEGSLFHVAQDLWPCVRQQVPVPLAFVIVTDHTCVGEPSR